MSGKRRPFGTRPSAVARAADALEQRGDRAGRADLQHEVDLADVDAELERGGRDQRAQRAGLEPLLGVEPPLAREAAVVARHGSSPSRFESRAAMRSASFRVFTKTSVVRCSPISCRQPLVDLVPLLVRADGGERRGRDLDREIELAEGARVDELAVAGPAPTRNAPTSASGFCVAESPMPLDGPAAQRLEPLEREREVRAALVARERVDLVDDDGARGREQSPARRRS